MSTIEIISDQIPLDEIETLLHAQPGWSESGITLNMVRPASPFRSSLDPTALVAIIGAASAALVALIAFLAKIAELKGAQKIKMVGKDWELEIPAGLPKKEMDELLRKVRQESNKIVKIELHVHKSE